MIDAKIGNCPILSPLGKHCDLANSCQNDTGCPNNMKCCSNGCPEKVCKCPGMIVISYLTFLKNSEIMVSNLHSFNFKNGYWLHYQARAVRIKCRIQQRTEKIVFD